MSTTLLKTAQVFFQKLNEETAAQQILKERDHKVQFVLTDGDPFYVEVRRGEAVVKEGEATIGYSSHTEVTRLESSSGTFMKIFQGEMRYADALNPNQPGGEFVRMLDKLGPWMYRRGDINWLGRLIRIGQEQRLLR